jgi:hypothetical protein
VIFSEFRLEEKRRDEEEERRWLLTLNFNFELPRVSTNITIKKKKLKEKIIS